MHAIPIIVSSARPIIGQSGQKMVFRTVIKNWKYFQVDLEWLVHWTTAPENFDGASVGDRRWRYYRPTRPRPHLEGPSRLKSTYTTRLAGLTVNNVYFRL